MSKAKEELKAGFKDLGTGAKIIGSELTAWILPGSIYKENLIEAFRDVVFKIAAGSLIVGASESNPIVRDIGFGLIVYGLLDLFGVGVRFAGHKQ